jgi:hypothetical protein
MRARLPIMLAALMIGSAPSLAQERIWTLDQTDAEVYLVFGVPETDDVGVSFWCTQQSGIAKLYLPEAGPDFKPGMSVDVELKIAAKIYAVKGKAAFNEESGGTSLESELRVSDPVFSALRAANYFAVKIGSSNHVFPLGEADFSTFLDECGQP